MIIDVSPILAAASVGVWNVLWDILVLLTAALLLGTVAGRLGQSVIVGYLVAGTLVGPNVLGWISTQAELFNVAELGVALLLFAIGLEFSPRRLLNLGSVVVKTGPLQVVLTATVGIAVCTWLGLPGREPIVVGLIVTMSSTACVLRVLTDRTELDSQHGRTALGILLVQDVAVVPMMLLVGIMSTGGDWGVILRKLAFAMLLAAALVVFFVALFRYVAPRLMLLPTWRKHRDLPVLLGAIMATGSAWATHTLGLSAALGAFTAGAMLAMSPFATQIRADTRPLTTLMVTLFFSSIGMFGDPAWFVAHWPLVIGGVAAIIVGKPLIIAVLARLCGQTWRDAVAAGLCLAQIGEFSFILATIAQSDVGGEPLLSSTTFQAVVAATIVTLLLTPYFVSAALRTGVFAERLRSPRIPVPPARPSGRGTTVDRPAAGPATGPAATIDGRPSDDSRLILIVGYGPAGQRAAADLLAAHRRELVVIDLNPENIAVARRQGLQARLGDATQLDVLEDAGINRTRVVVITAPHHATARDLIYQVRDIAPDVYLVVRCRYQMLQWELLQAGAHEVVNEEEQVGRRLAACVRRHETHVDHRPNRPTIE